VSDRFVCKQEEIKSEINILASLGRTSDAITMILCLVEITCFFTDVFLFSSPYTCRLSSWQLCSSSGECLSCDSAPHAPQSGCLERASAPPRRAARASCTGASLSPIHAARDGRSSRRVCRASSSHLQPTSNCRRATGTICPPEFHIAMPITKRQLRAEKRRAV
jgi:hypothetical protein